MNHQLAVNGFMRQSERYVLDKCGKTGIVSGNSTENATIKTVSLIPSKAIIPTLKLIMMQ